MAIAVKMPKMSDTMTEGVIVDWNVKVGDQVSSGDILAEVETDKATMDLENYDKGEILHLAVAVGEAIPVDGVVAIIGKKGEKFEDLLVAAPEAKNDTESKVEETSSADSISTPEPVANAPLAVAQDLDTARVKASPLAKKMAADKGIDLSAIAGSGDGGRIIKADIENYTPAVAGASVQIGQESYEDIPLSQMRKTIAKRLSESKFEAPHFYLTMEINMDRAVAARSRMNEMAPVKISMNDLIIKAASAALKQNPKVNSSWLGDRIRLNHHIHIGVAMAVDEGLLVPVVRFADQKSLSQISTEVKAYSAKAKDKKLQPEDWAGNTFTISNLGMFGIEEFTAIVNPPDSCIMAVGTVKDVAGVVNGEIRPTKVMKVTLSCDHRAVDGAVGSGFLKSFKALLEDPVTLLV